MGVGARGQAPGVGANRGGRARGLRGGGHAPAYLGVRWGVRCVRGVFIALALAWGVVVDGFRPDRWDLLGATICVVGVLVMVAPPRG